MINGWDIPVAVNTPRRTDDELGSRGRSGVGQMRSHIRRQFRELGCSTTIQRTVFLPAIEGLIQGRGHYFSFDDESLFSSKGLKPEEGHDTTFVPDGGKYQDAVQVDDELAYGFGYTDEWTVMFWEMVDNTHHAFRSDGAGFEGGNGAPPPGFTSMSEGVLTFTKPAGDIQIDELVVVPYVAPREMIQGMIDMDEKYSPLPVLKLSGPVIDVDQIYCEGAITRSDYQVAHIDGAYRNNSQVVSFELTETEVVE